MPNFQMPGQKGFLHPSHRPNNPTPGFGELFPHLNTAHPKLLRQMSGKDAGETLSRFGRATRRQNKEFHATIHPLSGRMMSLSRGGESSVRSRFAQTKTQERAEALAERTKNPEVKRRAQAISQPIGMRPGIRPISVHSHPAASHLGTTRTHPSGQDFIGGHEQHSQNVVASHRPDPKRGGKNTSLVWTGRSREVSSRDASRLMANDFGTQGKIKGSTGGAKAFSRGFSALQRVKGGSTDYDTLVRQQTGGRAGHPRKGSSAVYTRQQFVKRAIPKELLREHFGTPRTALATLRRNPEHLAAGGVLATGAGAQARPLEHRRTQQQQRRADVGSAAVVGGAAGRAGWLGTGHEIRRRGHQVERERPEGMSRSQHQKLMARHHRFQGVPQNTKPDKAHAPSFYREYPRGLPASKYKRRLGQMSGRRGAVMQAGVVGGSALLAGGAASRRKVRKAAKPTEYQPGQPLERYSAERRRRGVVAEGAAYGAAGTGAGLGATMLGNAKIAGTRVGQHTLTQAQNHLERTGHPGAKQIGQIKQIGQWANKRPRRTGAGVAGLTAAAAGLGMAARLRNNEEAGISQGIGRIKAGESYAATQRRVTTSKGLVRAALMASDADLNNPNIRRGLDIANRHGKKIVGGTLIGSGSVAAYASARGMSNRRKQTQQLRDVTKLYVRDRQVSPVHAVETGAGLALGAWGLGRSKMLGRALAHGVKEAQGKQNAYAVEALQRAQMAQGLLARHTARGERQLRQIRAVDAAVQRVPAAIRPEVAAAAGMLLVAQGHPVRRDTYHPVNLRVRGGF